ncbi:hypothetical protein XCR_1817 [Xanthomonas campestris pv. raphani 756C]|nr:hypothetical protein XCR_1817 [Xanthomonas campestris pv. raphani 756C]
MLWSLRTGNGAAALRSHRAHSLAGILPRPLGRIAAPHAPPWR